MIRWGKCFLSGVSSKRKYGSSLKKQVVQKELFHKYENKIAEMWSKRVEREAAHPIRCLEIGPSKEKEDLEKNPEGHGESKIAA